STPYASGAPVAPVRRGSRNVSADGRRSGRRPHAGPLCRPPRNSRAIPAHGAPGCASSVEPMTVQGRHLALSGPAVRPVGAAVITLRHRPGFNATARTARLEDSLQVVARRHADLSARINNKLAPGPLSQLGESLGLRTPTDNEIERVQVPRP